jgi:hypothetical protein
MPSKSPKQQRFFQAVMAAQKGKPSSSPHVNKVAHSISAKDAEDFANSLAELKIKKAVLGILKDVQEPMYLNEEDEDQAGIDPVANTFHVKEDWATYIKPYVGQPLSPKELEALGNFKEKQPTTVARTEIWYNTTDSFSLSHTTVIRKMKDSGQFSFIAFQKQERPETDDEKEKDQGMNAGGPEDLGLGGPEPDQGQAPEGGAVPGGPTPPAETPEEKPEQEEKDDIIVTKSVLFKDDIKGAAILVEFLKKLDL